LAKEEVKTIKQLISERKITNFPEKEIKEIKPSGLGSTEVVLNSGSHALIVHSPVLDGPFEQVLPLSQINDFSYYASFGGTALQIEFDNFEVKNNISGKEFSQEKHLASDNYKIQYNFNLPSADFIPRMRISSNSPIVIKDSTTGRMDIETFSLSFETEYYNGYQIYLQQPSAQVVYVNLYRNYSAEDKQVDDPIIIDPTLSLTSAMTVCGNVYNFDIVSIQAGGTMNICDAKNTSTAKSGWVNFSLGYFGNFSLDPGGNIWGVGSGGPGGNGTSTSGETSWKGVNGTGGKRQPGL